jgi:hypothetical protein
MSTSNSPNKTARTTTNADGVVFPPLITTEMLQYRLDTGVITKNSGQRSSLTRCVQKFGNFQSKLAAASNNDDNDNRPDTEDIESSKDDLIRELSLFELEMTKLILYQQHLETQIQRNNTSQHELVKQIQDLTNEIRESTSKASRGREIQSCMSEYEALAKLINGKHPISCEELQNKIDLAKQEATRVDNEIIQKDKVLNIREAQYQLLVQYMLDLKRSLKEGEDDEECGGSDGGDKPVPMDVTDNLYGDLL